MKMIKSKVEAGPNGPITRVKIPREGSCTWDDSINAACDAAEMMEDWGWTVSLGKKAELRIFCEQDNFTICLTKGFNPLVLQGEH